MEGVIELSLKVVCVETVVLASVSEFGDLASYAMVSQGCQAMQRQLAASMTVVRNHGSSYFVISPAPLGLCSCCSGYGDDLGAAYRLGGRRCFPCDLCAEAVCEHCVCLATFGGDGVHPTSWLCLGCHSDEESVCTVEPIRSWLIDVVDGRMLDVYKDYDISFYFQIITLAGDDVCDEQKRPCNLLHSSWCSSFDRVWRAVYYATGGRIRQMVIAGFPVDEVNLFGVRWSHLLTRSGARAYREESPLQVTVLLRDWF